MRARPPKTHRAQDSEVSNNCLQQGLAHHGLQANPRSQVSLDAAMLLSLGSWTHSLLLLSITVAVALGTPQSQIYLPSRSLQTKLAQPWPRRNLKGHLAALASPGLSNPSLLQTSHSIKTDYPSTLELTTKGLPPLRSFLPLLHNSNHMRKGSLFSTLCLSLPLHCPPSAP